MKEIIDGLDLSQMVKAHRGSGSASCHAAKLLGLLVHGYLSKVFSSREIERATYDSVALRHLAGNDHSDHHTTAAFRRRFLGQIEAWFVDVLKLAREMDILHVGQEKLTGKKLGHGFDQCYNAHAAVAAGSLLAVANAVTQAGNDKRQLAPMIEKLKPLPHELGPSRGILADNGTRHCIGWRKHFAPPPKAPTASTTRLQQMAHRLKTPADRKCCGGPVRIFV